MQTSRENITLAGTQVPLLREDQLQPGVLVTGVAMSHVWEVMGITGSSILIRKLPATTVPCAIAAHTFAPFGRGHVCSACEVRKQPIVDFLPKREDKARAHILTPRNTLLAPQPYTVYGFRKPNGEVQTVHVTGTTWDQALPVLPSLAVIWTIPESLRAMVSGQYGPSAPTTQVNF